MGCSAEGWREEELLVQPSPHPPTALLYNTHSQKTVRRWTWPSCRSQSSADLHEHRIWTNDHNLSMLIFTSCKMKMKGWKTKSPKDKMHDTPANAWKHLDKMGRNPKFSHSTLVGTHWNLTMALSCGNTTALVIQAVRLEILTSTLGGVEGKMTPLFLLSIEIKQFATKGKHMHVIPSVCFQSQQCV